MNTLRATDVARKTGLAVSTVWKWAKDGRLPKPFYPNPKVALWDEADVDNWLATIKEKCHGNDNGCEAESGVAGGC